MLQETRLQRIIRELGVSRETARRDINELEALGLARRVHGGLVAIETPPEHAAYGTACGAGEGKTRHQTLSNEIILLGGNMSAGAQKMRGEITVGEIVRYRADVALLSPVGIEASRGATSFHPIARAMVQQSATCILLADHSKLGVISRTVYAPPQAITTPITDGDGNASAALAALQQALPQVMVV